MKFIGSKPELSALSNGVINLQVRLIFLTKNSKYYRRVLDCWYLMKKWTKKYYSDLKVNYTIGKSAKFWFRSD